MGDVGVAPAPGGAVGLDMGGELRIEGPPWLSTIEEGGAERMRAEAAECIRAEAARLRPASQRALTSESIVSIALLPLLAPVHPLHRAGAPRCGVRPTIARCSSLGVGEHDLADRARARSSERAPQLERNATFPAERVGRASDQLGDELESVEADALGGAPASAPAA